MNTQFSHHDSGNDPHNGTESRSSLSEQQKHLEEYFQAARTENVPLFTKHDMQDMVRHATIHPRPRFFRHLHSTIQYAPFFAMALAGAFCVAIGFGIAHLPSYLQERTQETQVAPDNTVRNEGISGLVQHSVGMEPSVAKHPSKSEFDRLPAANKRQSKNDTASMASTKEAETLFPVFAGLPPNRTTRLQSIHFLELGVEELSRLGVTISGRSTVEIMRRLPLKDSSKSALVASWSVRAESLRPSVLLHHNDEQKNAPVLLTAESLPRSAVASIRPYILTDTLGRTLSVLPPSESLSESAQQQWQFLFRGYDSRAKNDTTVTLLAIRLQSAPGFHAAELRNIVFWYRATPALIDLLPARLQEQMYSELRVGTLSQRLTNQRSKDSYAEYSGEKAYSTQTLPPSAYYLAQTQTLVPNVLTLGSSIQRTKAGSPLRVSFSLYESRSLRITLHSISGSLVQELASLPAALGQQTVHLALRAVPSSGIYFLVFRTEYNETALQYLFVD